MSLAYVDKFLEKTLLPVQNENLQLIMLTALHMADETERAGGGLSIQTCELSTVNFRIPLSVDKIHLKKREMLNVLEIDDRLHPVTFHTLTD